MFKKLHKSLTFTLQNTTFFNCLLILILSVLGMNRVEAQAWTAYNYTGSTTVTDATAAYSAITGTSLFGTTWDGATTAPSGAINLGFTFQYNGVNYTQVYISPNGFLTFGSAPSTAEYFPISSGGTYAGAIAAYGRRMINSGASTVSYLSSGGVFTVQWVGVRQGATGTMNIQIKLYQTTNKIEVYHRATLTSTYGGTNTIFGQIGLRGSSNAQVNNLNWQPATNPNDWPTSAPVLPNNNLPANSSYTVKTKGGATTSVTNLNDTKFTWTPITCLEPSTLTIPNASISITGATANWSLVATNPAYQYEIRTGGVPGSGAFGLVASGSTLAGVSTTNFTGLTGGTQYYVYVRSDCGGSDYSTWKSVSFTTLCNATNVPYLQDFSSATIPALPTCTSAENLGTGLANPWVTSAPTSPSWGFDDTHLRCGWNNVNNSNAIFYTQGINLLNTQSYKLSYKYGNSREFTYLENKMDVYYGTSPNIATMTLMLANHTNIKGSPITNALNFTPPTSDVYYFAFRDTSVATAAGTTLLDDIRVDLSTCIAPTGLSSGLVTSSSATIGWTAPTTAPAGGYQYYYNTSSTAPTNATIANGSVGVGVLSANLTGLSSSTTYYFWVRSNCGGGDVSLWSSSGTFTTTAPVTPIGALCTPSFSTATEPICNVTFNTINNSSSCALGGASYTDFTPTVSTTVTKTSTYAISVSGNTGGAYENYINAFIDFNSNGDFTDAGESFAIGSINNCVGCSVTGSITIPATAVTGIVRMRIMKMYLAYATSCNTAGYGEAEDYTIVINPAPAPLALDAVSTTTCSAVNSSVVSITPATFGNYTSYSWFPSATVTPSGASGYQFNPLVTTTYTLTGFNSTTFETNTATLVVNVNQPPTAITVTPSSASVCSTPQQLVATGGVILNQPIVTENFNGTATGWTAGTTTAPAHSGGTPANGLWTLRPNGYNTGGIWNVTMVSNDASQYYLTNSDAQGLGSTTHTILTSPVIPLTGYTTASLSFYHFFRAIGGDSAKVLISSSPTFATSTQLQNYTTTQGASSSFALATFDLTPYVGLGNVYIRFEYTGDWAWGWAIDNFNVTGNAPTNITWNSVTSPVATFGSPIPGLFTDVAGTVSYTQGSSATTVYALPSSTTTYAASASSGSGCSTSTNVIVDTNATIWNGSSWSSGLPNSSKRAEFAGNYTSSADALLAASGTPMVLNVCSVTVTGGAIVTFSPNYILNVENTVNTLGGTMNFLEGASLIQDNDVTNGVGVTTGGNVGDIHYTRSTTIVSEYDYTYWSSPVANQALSNVSPDSPNDYYYYFSPAIANWVNIPSINLMDVGKGYIIRAPYYANGSTGYASTFIGTPNSGTITTPIVMGPTTTTPIFRETNLIGNPYPSAINAIAFLSDAANINNVEGTMYFWTHTTPITANNYTAADYAVFNYSGSTATSPGTGAITPNGYVAAGQSFMIKGINPIAPYPTGASVKSVTFKNSMRAGVGYSNSQFFRSNSSHNDAQTTAPISEEVSAIMNLERNRLWLDVSNTDGLFKQTLVGYIQNATDGLDRGFDGEVVNAGNQVSLYTMVDTTKLGIQALALPFDSNDIISLGFMSAIASSYTISLSNFDGLFNDQDVYLEDKVLNIVHNLKDSNYTFSTTIGTFEDRFQLRFTNALGVNNPEFNENTVLVFKQNQNINVSSSTILIDKIEVFDIRGRQLFSKNGINSNEFSITNLDSSQQVLIVKVTSDEGKIVNKKVTF